MPTKIEWTKGDDGSKGETWNPVTGCTKISAGCKNCYAEKMALRLQRMGQANYRDGFAVRTHPHMLGLPLKWKKPRRVFVASMSDLFHEEVPFDFISQVFGTMRMASQHCYMVLTKRPDRMLEFAGMRGTLEPAWAGVTVEYQRSVHRIDTLHQVNAPIRWISAEPLLGPLPNLNLDGISWIAIGGESGPGARPSELEWIEDLVRQCDAAGVAPFVKQYGTHLAKRMGLKGKGADPSEWPEHLRRREFPGVGCD